MSKRQFDANSINGSIRSQLYSKIMEKDYAHSLRLNENFLEIPGISRREFQTSPPVDQGNGVAASAAACFEGEKSVKTQQHKERNPELSRINPAS